MNIEEINPDNKDYLIYTNYSACKFCGGACCKSNAGAYSPDDFKYPITTHLIIHLLLTKKFAIDSIGDDSHDKTYFLRPRHMEEDPIKPELFGGICINWSLEKGCSLEEHERPLQCRALIPLYDRYQCRSKPSDKASKSEIANLWTEYNDMFEMAVNSFKHIQGLITYMYVPDEKGNINIHDGIREKTDAIKEILHQLW